MPAAHAAAIRCNRQIDLSLPGSRFLLLVSGRGGRRRAWQARWVLGSMRDRRGGPSAGSRLLALLVALLLAGPLTYLVLRALLNLLSVLT